MEINNWYNKQGEKLTDMEEIEQLFGDFDYKVVDRTEVGDMLISTVWLGLDHRMYGEGDPLIFETMVFSDGEDPEKDMRRYPTLEEAKKGHQELVDKYKNHESTNSL